MMNYVKAALGFLLAEALLPGGASAAIRLPEPCPPCVTWAMGDVTSALQTAGIGLGQADITVSIALEMPAESFRLAPGASAVSITAGDAVGAMYGLQELAEQIETRQSKSVTWTKMSDSLAATSQRPYVDIRADNAFCQVNPLLFKDVTMWKAYIDGLARSRYNLLDIHGGFDRDNTGFPNLYPMLVHVPDYPNVGVEAEQAENLADFKEIISYASSRGVRVSFMNYSANVGGVPADKLADYTSKAVTTLLNALPDLYMLGFRIGETGQKADFFQAAYLKGIAQSNHRDIRLYTRSWLTDQKSLAQIGQAAGGKFDIEIKYNGEHLGLPYHAIHGAGASYSYQDYIQPKAPYQIIWQVRANGTHRFWAWENTDFIRRTVQTLHFGGARGFTLEPQIAYFPVAAASYYRQAADQNVYTYIWQKYWPWYFAWGRLSYNPELPERTLQAAFARRYGAAGEQIYQALQEGSKIVPLAYTYRCPGYDHRDFSPETETGAFNFRKSKDKSADLLSFARNTPLDSRSFVGIDEFVKEKIAGKADGRIGPAQVASMFKAAAKATRKQVAAVGDVPGRAGDEWRLLRTDLLCAASLADYYGARIAGMMRLDYALKTGCKADYGAGVDDLARSRDAWKALAGTADAVFAPLNNPLRHQVKFQWDSQLQPLEELDASAKDVWAAVTVNPQAAPLVLTASDRGEDSGIRFLPHQPKISSDGNVTFTGQAVAAAGVSGSILHFKPLPSEEKWKSIRMDSAAGGTYSVTIPLPAAGLLYKFEVQDRNGNAAMFPNVLQERPYWIIPPG